MLQGTLKTKLDTNSSMNMEDFPKEISKQSFRKHLMTTSFLNLKGKLASMNNQKFCWSKSTRKYFGSKIARLTNYSKNRADYVKSYFRYFQQVDIEEVVEAEDRVFTVTIKSLGNLGIRNQHISLYRYVPNQHIKLTSLRRMLSVCRCKVSIVSFDHENVERWLPMPIHIKNNIKHIELGCLITKHSQLLEDTHLFKYFNNLESCRIFLADVRKPNSIPLGFMIALSRIKTLQSVELDLSRVPISREMLTVLLNQISKNEPFRWYLKVVLKPKRDENYPIEIGKVKNILNKLDFLSLTAAFPDVNEEWYHAPVDGYPYEIYGMKQLTNKRKRILDIEFPECSIQRLNLKDLLDNCTSLKGIHITSVGPCFEINQDNEGEQHTIQNEEVEHLIQSKNWTSNIEDVALSFNSNDSENSSNSACNNLLSALQKRSHNLRSLELFCCASFEDYAYHQKRKENVSLGRKDLIKMPIHGLERFVLLEELKLTSDGSDLHTLEPVLQNLSNLKKLELRLGVGSEKQAPWDKDFPFKSCRNLQELKITINHDMKGQPWGKSFIKNCHYLQKLNILKINDENRSMFLKTFCSLVRILLDLKNLRKLILKAQVNSSVAFQEMPEELEESFKSSVDALLESLKTQVKTFVVSNRKLEKLYIGSLNRFKFKDIQYASR